MYCNTLSNPIYSPCFWAFGTIVQYQNWLWVLATGLYVTLSHFAHLNYNLQLPFQDDALADKHRAQIDKITTTYNFL